MADRNCAIAPSTSPAPSSLFPEFVENRAACRLLVAAAIFAPAFASSAAPCSSPNWRSTAASVVCAPAKSSCNRIASRSAAAAAQRVMRFRVVGLMLNRRLQFFGRLVKFASLPVQNSERIVRIRQVWLQPDRVLELGNRLVELILQLVGEAQIVVRSCILGRKLDGGL